MDDAFYGFGSPYFGRLMQYYWLRNGIFGQTNQGVPGCHYGTVAVSQGHGGTPDPLESLYVSLSDGWGPLRRWVYALTALHTCTHVQAGLAGSSQFGGSEAGFGLVWPA